MSRELYIIILIIKRLEFLNENKSMKSQANLRVLKNWVNCKVFKTLSLCEFKKIISYLRKYQLIHIDYSEWFDKESIVLNYKKIDELLKNNLTPIQFENIRLNYTCFGVIDFYQRFVKFED